MHPLARLQARWETDGTIIPLSFEFSGRLYSVSSVGRSWRDDAGYHVLCMVGSDDVYELLLTHDFSWQVKIPMARSCG